VHGESEISLKATVGCHCTELALRVDRKRIDLQVWDTAGQEMYRALVPVYLRGAHAAILVYDRTDRDSFQALTHWCSLLDDTVSPNTLLFLVANKVDLVEQHTVSDDLGEQFAASRKAKFYKVSALTGEGVEQLFLDIAADLIKMKESHVDAEKKGITMYSEPKKQCSC
jgi:small GTP-binding protein